MKANYRKGQRVVLSDEGRQNENYTRFFDAVLVVEAVSKSRRDHPGFDEGAGSPLYDFAIEDGRVFPFSLYEWEFEAAPRRARS